MLQFISEATLIGNHFPDLHFFHPENEEPFIAGILKLLDEEGHLVDSYHIKIKASSDYPNRFPLVYETSGRLPHNIDWHVYPDGHCCIACIPEEILICRRGLMLVNFIQEWVVPYFFNQKFRETNGYFLNERSHGALGNFEFFMDVLGTRDLNYIKVFLNLVLETKEPNRVSDCFCGSERKYRYCHRTSYRILRQFKDRELLHFISEISKYLNTY